MLAKAFSNFVSFSIFQEIFVNICKDANSNHLSKKAYESMHLNIVQSVCSHSSQKPLKDGCVHVKKQILYNYQL